MKKFKNALLASAIILVSGGSAFATNNAKQGKSASEQGFVYDPAQPTVKCIETSELCDVTGSELCTWSDAAGTHQLYKFINGTMCGQPLYRN